MFILWQQRRVRETVVEVVEANSYAVGVVHFFPYHFISE